MLRNVIPGSWKSSKVKLRTIFSFPGWRGMFDIDKHWETIKDNQTFVDVVEVDPDIPKAEGHTRFVCVSDTHAQTQRLTAPNMPEGDVLIHAGDFSNVGMEKDIIDFNAWLKDMPYDHKIVIAGNHDVSFDTENYCSELYERFHKSRGLKKPYDPIAIKNLLTNCIYLEDSAVNVLGFDIYGR